MDNPTSTQKPPNATVRGHRADKHWRDQAGTGPQDAQSLRVVGETPWARGCLVLGLGPSTASPLRHRACPPPVADKGGDYFLQEQKWGTS